MRRLAMVAAVLAGSALAGSSAAGCGGQSAAEKLLDQRKAVCNASLGTTVGALSGQWGAPTPVVSAACETRPGVFATPNGSCDPTVLLCRISLQEFFAVDGSTCGPNGCTYKCTVWVPAPPGATGSDITVFSDAVICSQQFAQGQP